jgi:parvulin-like peptidyl-prolyl isomerase
MFEMLRKMIFPIIIIVLVVFLGMIVLQWGLDIAGRGQGLAENIAGKINGEEVSWQAYQRVYNNIYQSEAQARDYDIPDERIRQLEQQAWQEIVTDRLLSHEADQYNIHVTDRDVFIYLQVNPPQFLRTAEVFQTNGQFDRQKYMSAMVDPQFAGLWNSIDPQIRSELRKVMLQQMIIQSAHVSDEEVRQAFLDKNETITVGAVNAMRSRFANLVGEPSDDELRAYYNDNKEEYRVGERVVLDIVKLAKAPSPLDSARAEARAAEIYDSVTTGSDFAEFARIYSDDVGTASEGGDLGWFVRGRMVNEFDSVVWSMDEGDISKPVKTSFGWHIIKNNGFRETDQPQPDGSTKKVEEVNAQHILIKPQPSDETLEALWQQLENVRTASENQDFKAAAEGEGLEVETTDPLTSGSTIASLGGAREVVDWAFANDQGTVSQVMDLGTNVCVVRLKEKLPAGYADFEQVKDQVAREVVREMTLNICNDTIQMVFDDVEGGAALDKAADKYGLSYEELPPFTRDGRVAALASDPTAIGAAFALTDVGQISEPVDYGNGSVIFKLINRTSPDLTRFNEVRDSVYNAVMQTKQSRAYSNWFAAVRDSADILSNIDFQRRR